MTLLTLLTLLLRSLTVTFTILLFYISFFLDTTICSIMTFPSLENSDHVSLFPQSFRQTRNGMHRFIAYDYSRADWNSLRNHLRDVPWKDIFKFTASAASEFYEWVQVGIEWDPLS